MMTMHLLPERRRAIAFIFPAIIVVIAVAFFPLFVDTGRGWWLVFILAPASVVAVIICIEFRATAIGFDAHGVHYRTVGYSLDVPWSGIQFHANCGKPILCVTQGERHFSPWLGVMYGILHVLMPFRAERASRLMTQIPLYFFMISENDSVMVSNPPWGPATTK
ncbi:hypothetical protein [Rhizobium sp. Root482]|uniref:hypothetical protein n=1 Tax=Rhizobium sp. Root482 TaxID=1736543 RepID=UPI000ABB89A6|nr:hypothetical protein [Rhizobium sp. Root482]